MRARSNAWRFVTSHYVSVTSSCIKFRHQYSFYTLSQTLNGPDQRGRHSEVGEILGKAPNAISSITSILGYYRIRIPVTEFEMHVCTLTHTPD